MLGGMTDDTFKDAIITTGSVAAASCPGCSKTGGMDSQETGKDEGTGEPDGDLEEGEDE